MASRHGCIAWRKGARSFGVAACPCGHGSARVSARWAVRALWLATVAVALLTVHPGSASAQSDRYAEAVSADGPFAYYRLDEESGSTVFDSAAPAEDGTYVGPRPSTSRACSRPGKAGRSPSRTTATAATRARTEPTFPGDASF